MTIKTKLQKKVEAPVFLHSFTSALTLYTFELHQTIESFWFLLSQEILRVIGSFETPPQ